MAHPSPASSEPLRGSDLQAALHFVSDLADTIDDAEAFAHCGVEQLPRLAASEVTTLSLCDLRSHRRHVVGFPAGAIGAEARASFDRHFDAHPLVRYHAVDGGPSVRRISDSMAFAAFRETALYDEYYLPVGIDHAVALPVHVGGGWLVSFVLNRRGSDFSEREVGAARAGAPGGRPAVSPRRLARANAPFLAVRCRRGGAAVGRGIAAAHAARARRAALGRGGQDRPRHRRHPRHQPSHRAQAPRACLRQARRRNAHRRGDARDCARPGAAAASVAARRRTPATPTETQRRGTARLSLSIASMSSCAWRSSKNARL